MNGYFPDENRRSKKLTEIEIRIMEQLVEGSPDDEAAEAIGMKFFTFKTHLKRIFRKLNARNRTHAVVIFLRQMGRLNDLLVIQ